VSGLAVHPQPWLVIQQLQFELARNRGQTSAGWAENKKHQGEMMNSCKAILYVTSALSAGLIVPATAQAPDNGQATQAQQIEQVVVTARRREERLQDVPISITVFNQQQLTNHNVINAGDLAAYTPSLSVNTDFGSENSSFAIRGFVQDIGTAPSVGVFFDDVVSPHAPTQGNQAGDGAGPGDFFDLQNVQVLKGPQGTLFGRNTTGGDILLVPQRPTDVFGGYVQGSFGNYDMRGGQGIINIPVSDDIRLRFGIDHQSREGYLHNTSGIGPSDFDDVDYTALRGSIDIDLTPDLENYTVATYSDSDSIGDFGKMVACDPVPQSAAAQLFVTLGSACKQLARQGGFYDGEQTLSNPESKFVQWRVIDTTTWHESNTLTIKNIASYAQAEDNLVTALFGTNFKTPPIASIPGVFPGLRSFPFDFASGTSPPGLSSADQATYTEELQLQGNGFDNRLTWQAGAYLEGDVPLSLNGEQSAVLSSCTNVQTFQCYDPIGLLVSLQALETGGHPTHVGEVNYTVGRTWDNDYAIYGQATYKLTDEFSLTGGYRYTWDRESNTSTQISNELNFPLSLGPVPPIFTPLPPGVFSRNCTNPLAPGYTTGGFGTGPLAPGACTLTFRERSNAPTWLLDLDWKPTDDILAYIKWARGYRQGIVNANVTEPYNTTGPEKVDTYEAGAKTSWDYDGISGTFNADGFYNDFRNQQLLLGFDPNPICFTGAIPCVSNSAAPVNAGKSRIWGVEVDTTIVPYEGLSFQLGYTHLDTKILSVKTFTTPPTSLYEVVGAIHKGDPITLSPPNKVSLTAAYVLPLEDRIGKITFSTTFTHTDSQVTNYEDRTIPYFAAYCCIQATNLLDLNLNWEQVMGKPLDLSVFATNVTGDRYYTFIPGLAASVGFETAQLGQPPLYGVRVKVHFGAD
jgi:iron complex outermembrane receptor protein